ncbi:MAG: HAMP domain-containing protein, partial [Pseudomonadota bacterium]|nr:HAMP domain-containing protein [Pseudomonadota bacterium]
MTAGTFALDGQITMDGGGTTGLGAGAGGSVWVTTRLLLGSGGTISAVGGDGNGHSNYGGGGGGRMRAPRSLAERVLMPTDAQEGGGGGEAGGDGDAGGDGGDAGGEVVYFLADGLGARLAGNLSAFPAPDETSRTSDDWITFNVPIDSALNKTDALPVRGRVIVLDNDLALLVARDIEPERAQLLKMARMFGSAMLVLVLIGLAGSVFMARRALARVDIISDSLQDIMQGRFETRVTLTGRGDEMTLLADRLNDMTTRINKLMSAMREVTDNIAHDLRTPLNR